MKTHNLSLLAVLAFTLLGCQQQNSNPEQARAEGSASVTVPYESGAVIDLPVIDLPIDDTGAYIVSVPAILGAIEPPPKPKDWHWVNIAQSPPPTLDTAPSHLSNLCTFLAQNGIDFASGGSSLGYSVSVRSDLAINAIQKIETEQLATPNRWARLEFRNKMDVMRDLPGK